MFALLKSMSNNELLHAKSMIDAIDLECFNRDVSPEWSSLFRNSRSTGCDSNFDIIFCNAYMRTCVHGTCVATICLLRECMED